jgi:hypothetical protein
MRKAITLLVMLITLAAAGVFPASAFAAPSHSAKFIIGKASYVADGAARKMDAAPFVANNRTYVPVRYLALALGVAEKDIGWDAKTRTVTLKLDDVTLKLTIDSKVLYVNGAAKQMDVAPVIKSGRTYLPARWVAEAFGYEVRWDAGTKTVLVYPPGQVVKPEPQPTDNKIDMTAARNGTLQPPVGVIAPPDKWGFPAKAVRMEFKVGSRYATVTRTDGSAYTLDLGAPCVFVIAKDTYPVVGTAEGYKAWLIQNYGKTVGYNSENVVIALEGKENTALYVPFIPVAEAFGVPKENIAWDGQHLAVFGFDGSTDGYVVLQASSKGITKKWVTTTSEVQVLEAEEGGLAYPLFVNNGQPMLGINSLNDVIYVLFKCKVDSRVPNLIRGYEGSEGGGWDYETGTVVITCEPC